MVEVKISRIICPSFQNIEEGICLPEIAHQGLSYEQNINFYYVNSLKFHHTDFSIPNVTTTNAK